MESVNHPVPFSLLKFVSIRLRYWAVSTARVAARHWQFFVLSIALLVPMGTPLRGVLIAIAYPLLQVLHEGQGIWYHFWRICTIQGLALLWVMLQRRAIQGGSFMVYATSLPLTLAQRRVADIMVLLAANTLLLAPFVAVLTLAPGLTHWHGLATVAGSLVFAMLVLLAQLGVLEGRGTAVIFILGADVVLSLAFAGHPPLPQWLALLIAIVLGVFSLKFAGRRRRRAERPKIAFQGLASLLRIMSPVRRIQIKILMSQWGTAVRLLVLIGLVLGSGILMRVFRFDERVLPTLVLTLSVIALVISGFYRTLNIAHRSVAHYTNALPLPQNFWVRKDHAFIALIGILPLVPLLWFILGHSSAVGFVLALVAGYFILLAGLRWPVIHGGRQALLLAVLMAASWSGVALAAIP